jgi:hypothetical protein
MKFEMENRRTRKLIVLIVLTCMTVVVKKEEGGHNRRAKTWEVIYGGQGDEVTGEWEATRVC